MGIFSLRHPTFRSHLAMATALALAASTLVASPARPASATATEVSSLDGLDAAGAFGLTVDVDGQHHIVGGTGEAFVIVRGADWGDRVALEVPGGNPTSFGSVVAIDMSVDLQYGVAIVGAPFDRAGGSQSGSAHVFEWTSATRWVFVESLVGTVANELVGLGVDVQILDDDRTANLLVGAPNRDDVGYVASWIRQRGSSSATQIVTGEIGGDVGDGFGSAVAIDGDTIVVGANLDDDSGDGDIFVGTAAVFSGDPAAAIAGAATMGWVEQATLTLCGTATPGSEVAPCGVSSGEYFGQAVAIDGDTIVVGAPLRSGRASRLVAPKRSLIKKAGFRAKT